MSALFGSSQKQKPDQGMIKSQQKQDEALRRQELEERKDLGARQRLMAARAKGRGPVTLFANPAGVTGAAKPTLGA